MKRLLIALSLLFLLTPQAVAHTALVSATPSENGVIKELPSTITLTFNEDLMVLGDKKINQIALTSPDGSEVADITSTTSGKSLSATIPATTGADGKYTVKYRITSADGHPVEGSYSFTIEKMSAPDLNKVSTDDDGDSEGGEAFTKIAAAIVAFGFLSYVVMRRMRK